MEGAIVTGWREGYDPEAQEIIALTRDDLKIILLVQNKLVIDHN